MTLVSLSHSSLSYWADAEVLPEAFVILPASFTFMTAVTFVAFFKGESKSYRKLHGYICIILSFLGALLAWLGFAIWLLWDKVVVSLMLLYVGSLVSLFPYIILFGWYIENVAKMLGIKPPLRKGVFFNIFNLGFGLIDIARIITFTLICWTVIEACIGLAEFTACSR